MTALCQFLYSAFAIPFLWTVLQFLGLFSAKVRRGIDGRRDLFHHLEGQTASLGPGKRVWFHSSSMGEFEQAKPIIAALKQTHPEVRVIVTFFSPSGYEHSRKYPHAEVISYLPFDTRSNARRFLDLIRPDAAVMVRYDIWPNHIWELRRRRIPTMIANATMRRQTERRIPLVRWFHHHVYEAIDEILTVSADDSEAFRFFHLARPRLEAIGDTRYDQVCTRSTEARKHTLLPPHVTQGKSVFVAGSTWPEDEAVIVAPLVNLSRELPSLLSILVPHEPTEAHLEELESELAGVLPSIRFSAIGEYAGEKIIIVDSIGILLRLYSHAHVAYIGGSFRQGIHNVLEAAVYGIPVLFGPRHRNSQEPLQLLGHGGAFVVNDTADFERTLRNLLENDSARKLAGECAARFVSVRTGATDRFLAHLAPYLTTPQQSRER